MKHEDAATRMRFVVELARRLHQYGAAAPRLESAIDSVSARLGLNCNSLSTPTALILSFTDREHGEDALSEHTQVIRLAPGDVNLRRLCEVDEIADRVTAGTLGIAEGARRLRAIHRRRNARNRVYTAAAYGVAAAAVAAILHATWADIAVAGAIGILIGAIALASEGRPRAAASFEAVSALLATLIANAAGAWPVALDVKVVVLAALIVLLPGLSLTTAVRELSTQHLASGVARLAGAMMSLLKLAFGTLAATQIALALHWVPPTATAQPVPNWAQWVALGFGCLSFAVLFQAARRDYLLVMASAAFGYVVAYYGSSAFTPVFGVFLAGLAIGAASNAYARLAQRPGALVREPGVILLVPGSVGFRTLSLMFERDVYQGLDVAFTLIAILVALVAGLLFGDLLVAPRRSL
ncbi:MAG: threonine/serine exporter family protein [Proteobacteria bacterium]|nr:threonine/serine exporter family protein [Pseudomonadota bacterium]